MANQNPNLLRILNVGLRPYEEVYELQKETVEKVKDGDDETLIICSHPPVVTLGKKSRPEDLQGWQGDIVSIERGGKATYHGPGQIVIYPILNLKKRGQNIAGFLEVMEQSMVKVLKDLGLEASGNMERGKPDYTGVWVKGNSGYPTQKIASIGVAVSRWVTYHGLAFNLEKDPLAFTGISPCGFTTETMTSLEDLGLRPGSPVFDTKPNRKKVEESLIAELQDGFSKLIL